MKNFRDINWLKENINREDLIIIDSRGELLSKEFGYEEFRKSHLKNAAYLSLEDHLSGKVGKHGGRNPMVDVPTFKEKLESIGMNNNSLVLIYDDGKLSMAARTLYLLKYIGKGKSYILEGGYLAIVEAGLELEAGEMTARPKGRLTIKIDSSILVGMEDVRERLDQGRIVIDSRARNRYEGLEEPLDPIAGHIAGAVNYPYEETMESNYDLDIVRGIFKDIGEKDPVVHCGSGVTGCVNFLFLEEIGLSPKLYLGGYSDWISYEENEPVSP